MLRPHAALYQAATTGKQPMTATIDLVNTGNPRGGVKARLTRDGSTLCERVLRPQPAGVEDEIEFVLKLRERAVPGSGEGRQGEVDTVPIGVITMKVPPGTGVVAIDDAGGDNQVCLCLASAGRSGVYHWDHEGEVDRHGHPTPDYSNMTLLASSSSDLISRLVPLPEEPAPSSAVRVNLRF